MKYLVILVAVFYLGISRAQIPAYVPVSGLVAYYDFSGNSDDISGNGINATYIGSGVNLTTDRNGVPNSAYEFDGLTGSYIEYAADNLPQGNRTVSLWFNVPTVSNRPMLLGYGGNSGFCPGNSFLMGLNVSGGATFQSQAHCNTNLINYSYPSEPINSWFHYVITIDGNVISMYVNGILVSTANTFVNATGTVGKELALGVMPWADGIAPYTDPNGGYLQGKLDDVGFWDRALTQCEILQLYQEGFPESSSTISACGSFTAPDGAVYTSSGVVTAIVPTVFGCDSTITIDLTVNTVDITVNQVSNILTASASAASFQWLDCNDNYNPLNSETSSLYTAIQNGSYAVQIDQNGCIDTSTCFNVVDVSLLENQLERSINVYPNPSSDNFTVDLGIETNSVCLELFTIDGSRLIEQNYSNASKINFDFVLNNGVYLLNVKTPYENYCVRILKN